MFLNDFVGLWFYGRIIMNDPHTSENKFLSTQNAYNKTVRIEKDSLNEVNIFYEMRWEWEMCVWFLFLYFAVLVSNGNDSFQSKMLRSFKFIMLYGVQ